MSRLARALIKAHSGEIAAYHAYEGHWRSLSNEEEIKRIKSIQRDELKHQLFILRMLDYVGERPSFVRDTVFAVIGKILAVLCRVSGRFLPMYGAMLIEKIGVTSYQEMLELAIIEGYPALAMSLLIMAQKEEEHRLYFVGLLNEKNNNKS